MKRFELKKHFKVFHNTRNLYYYVRLTKSCNVLCNIRDYVEWNVMRPERRGEGMFAPENLSRTVHGL